jgi:carboxyl-terminal processing protease
MVHGKEAIEGGDRPADRPSTVLVSSEVMSSTMVRVRRFILSCGLLLLAGGTAAPPSDAALRCERVPELLRTFLQKHISFHYLNDELRNRTAAAFVKRLDPSKTLFMYDEVVELRGALTSIFHDVRNGDCTKLIEINDVVVQRYAKLEEFVREVVGDEDYALDRDVELIIDPDKRGHARTPEYRDELRTKLIHFQMSNYMSSGVDLEEAKGKLIHRYELMHRRARETEPEDVYASFLDAFASALDPHSNYLSAEVLEDFQISMELSLEGIGVALSSRDGYSVVEKIIPGGAADQLNVLAPKDKIISVAQEEGEYVDIIDMNLRDVVRLIRGKRGTKVRLVILRQEDTTERLEVSIVRDKINLQDQAADLRFEEVETSDGRSLKLAVLELPSFYGGKNPAERQSSRDMRDLLKKVKEEKADGLLLDLSRNGGGLLENSVEIAGFFIGDGGVVAVKDTFSKVQVLRDPDESILFDGPMVVLTSRVSASASEIVAGAMKDYRRAVIVGGDHTFGKGTVQSMVPLPTDLGALKVTTALFFRPGGDSTQHSGVAADVVLPSLFSTDEFGESYQDYSLPQQRIAAFVEPDPTREAAASRVNSWTPVDPQIISELARRSTERIGESEEFAEILRKLKETEERNGVLRLAEILKEDEDETPDEKKGEEGAEQSSETSSTNQPGHVHRVAPGDTLWDLSRTYFGTPWEWSRIAAANLEMDPNRIESGVEIWIPGETETTRETAVATDDASEAPIEEPSDPSQLAENQAGPSDDEEAKMTPQQREALEILADFVNLTS